ncbi:MAG: rhomboid family intramembrane serine protease [bacterium]|nr:rhomboid family intramembrane serine protease [bacterium]
MIPLRDNIPASRRPVVTQAIVGICSVVWLLQLADPELLLRLGMVPARVLSDAPVYVELGRAWREPLPPALVPEWLTLLTCTFLHGGWLHFLGNMLFLWIFGDNVEDRLGRVGFVVFYVGCGVAASAAHLLMAAGSSVPTIGASGAIAGVMGGYMLLYPRARVDVLIVLFVFVDVVALPAILFLGIWFLFQFFQGTASLARAGDEGGVAFWAHVGGFVVGVITILWLRKIGRLRPERTGIDRGRRPVLRLGSWPRGRGMGGGRRHF